MVATALEDPELRLRVKWLRWVATIEKGGFNLEVQLRLTVVTEAVARRPQSLGLNNFAELCELLALFAVISLPG